MIRIAAFASVLALAVVAPALASAPPVGALPPGPKSTIATTKGQLVAVALPHAANGRVWRLARPLNAKVLREVSEADVGANVVIVFRAIGRGSATVRYGLTRGETAHAYASRTFSVVVR